MKRDVKNYSQHFLRGRNLIGELIGHSNIRKNDTVIDIGAGSGAITAILARRCKRVIAYELDSNVIGKLRQNTERLSNVEVKQTDFLSDKLPNEPYKIFANIPFALSSKIVNKLTLADNPPKSVYLIVQKQFANKLLLDNMHFAGALGQSLAPWWSVRIRRPLRKADFTPPPAVDTVLLEIKRKETDELDLADRQKFYDFVHNNYANLQLFKKLHLKELKPSELSSARWVEVYKANSTAL